jgi:ATP-dependent protease ClpP protease subunit
MKSLVLNRKQLPSGETLECKVTFNQADELLIYDIIMPQKTYDGQTYDFATPSDVTDFLKDAPRDFNVRINSSGGEVGAALAMYNRLLEHPGKVTTIVDGYAFSSAGWLAMAGSDRQICNGGLFMMHNPYLFAKIDSLNEIKNVQNRWESHRNSIVDIFTTRTSMKADEVQNLMEVETYMSASEAVAKGLFNSVRNSKPDTAILNCLHIPDAVKNKADVIIAQNSPIDISALKLRALNLRKNFLNK